MIALGGRFAAGAKPGQLIYLMGDLGSGKTTFVRGFLRGLGHLGSVKSPTYTLLEPYDATQFPVSHFDLYRLQNAEELEGLAIRDHLNDQRICVIEWPEKGEGVLPAADCTIRFEFAEPVGRSVSFHCDTELGRSLCACVEE